MRNWIIVLSAGLLLLSCATPPNDPADSPAVADMQEERRKIAVEQDKKDRQDYIGQKAEERYLADLQAAIEEERQAEIERERRLQIEVQRERQADTDPRLPPKADICPQGCTTSLPNCVIKGNISFDKQEKIYHLPACPYYAQTKIDPQYGERWFCTEDEARANGWRKAQNCPP